MLDQFGALGLVPWAVPWSASSGSSVMPEGTARSSHIPGLGWWPHISDKALSLIVPLGRTAPWGTDCLVASAEGWGGGGLGQLLPSHGSLPRAKQQERPNGQQRVSGGWPSPKWVTQHSAERGCLNMEGQALLKDKSSYLQALPAQTSPAARVKLDYLAKTL